MKNFRYIILSSILVIGAFSLVLYPGCASKCGSTTCQNGGTCSSNVCICPSGYSGNACQTGWTTPIIGTYNCKNESCNPAIVSKGPWQSAVTAYATNGGYTVNISNFDASPVNIAATVDSAQDITISSGSGGIGINGKGTYNAVTQTINLEFTTASAAGQSYTCNMVMVKIQ